MSSLRRLLGIPKPRKLPSISVLPHGVTEDDKRIIQKYAPYTLTNPLRQWALLNAIDYVDRMSIPGDIVECGVWRGGNVMLAKERRHNRAPRRAIYLFDTFSGMTAPTAVDINHAGVAASSLLDPTSTTYQELALADCSIDEVRQKLRGLRCRLG